MIKTVYSPKLGLRNIQGGEGLYVIDAAICADEISGSLTNLIDGQSFIAAGDNVIIVSSSNGQITISAPDPIVTTITGSYEVSRGIVLADATLGNLSATLPAALTHHPGRRIDIKKIDPTANVVNIVASGSDTIDGDATKSISTQWTSMTLVSSGAQWFIL